MIISLDNTEKSELIKKFDRFQASKHSVVPPSAFIEKGLYMLATILKNPRATQTQTTISIVETFAKVRELSKAIPLVAAWIVRIDGHFLLWLIPPASNRR